jgi:hypothetical protein
MCRRARCGLARRDGVACGVGAAASEDRGTSSGDCWRHALTLELAIAIGHRGPLGHAAHDDHAAAADQPTSADVRLNRWPGRRRMTYSAAARFITQPAVMSTVRAARRPRRSVRRHSL